MQKYNAYFFSFRSDCEIRSFKSATSLPFSNKQIISKVNLQMKKKVEGRLEEEEEEEEGRGRLEEGRWMEEDRKRIMKGKEEGGGRMEEEGWIEEGSKSREKDEIRMNEGERRRREERGEQEEEEGRMEEGEDRRKEEKREKKEVGRMTLNTKSAFFQIKNPKLSAKSWVIFDATNFRTMGSVI